mgnify:CR=1 FL=1
MGTNCTIKKDTIAYKQIVKPGERFEIVLKNKELNIYKDTSMHITFYYDNTRDTRSMFWADTDKNGKYDLKVIGKLKGNDVFLKLNEKENDIKKVQQAIIAQFQRDKKKEQLSLINGKIENFEQSTSVGDCWALAGIKALSNTSEGAKVIKETISKDGNGNVTVKLKGVNEAYTFSIENIIKAQERLSKGDCDVTALEMALEEHRKKVLKNGNYNRALDFTGLTKATNLVASGTEHYPLEPIYLGTEKYPLRLGVLNEVMFLLTGKDGKTCINVYPVNKLYHFVKRLFGQKEQASDIDNCLSAIEKEPFRYAATTAFRYEKGAMMPLHAYSINRVFKNHLILGNPLNSSTSIPISRKDFIKNCFSIQILDTKGLTKK